MSKEERQPPARVKYVGDQTIETPMSLADATGLYCVHCGHQPRWHVSSAGWPGPYVCITPEGCDCKRHGEELRWTGVAQAPNAGVEQTTGPGAYVGMTAADVKSNIEFFRGMLRPDVVVTGAFSPTHKRRAEVERWWESGNPVKRFWWLIWGGEIPWAAIKEDEETRHKRVLAEIAERHKIAKRFGHEMNLWPSPVECFIAELAGVNLEKVFEMIRTRGYLPGSIRTALGNLAGAYA